METKEMTRTEQSHELIMKSFAEGDGTFVERREVYQVAFLAEAADALESYLKNSPDDVGISVCMEMIDKRIKQIREKK